MTPPVPKKKFQSYVPEKTTMREFTLRAILLGLAMTVVLGAANLYLGLRAGMTIAATYPAAVMFRQAGRTEQAEKEEAERTLIESYLPAAASEAEMDAAIAEAMAESGAASVKQMGVVMKAVQAKLLGKTVDGKALSDKVRTRLS